MSVAIVNLQKVIAITPAVTATIHKLVRTTCRLRQISCRQVSVCMVDNARIRRLNRRWLNVNASTDVLAFDLRDRGRYPRAVIGDIVVSTEKARSNARLYKTSTLYEVYLYVVHGMLHLAGQKDTTHRLRLAMEQGARRILAHVYP